VTYIEDKEKSAQAEIMKRNEATIAGWAVQHPQFVDCVANRQMLSEYFKENTELTEEMLDFAFESLAGRLATQRPPTVAEINRQRNAMSTDELRVLAKRETPQISSAPKLPTEWTRESLVALTQSNIHLFKNLVTKYGSKEINKRLGVVKPQQPGYSVNMEAISKGDK
jgi:hypothetical protein